MALLVLAGALRPGRYAEPFAKVSNPLGLAGARGVMDGVDFAGWLLVIAGIGLGAAAMVVRLRGARGIERQQLKLVLAIGSGARTFAGEEDRGLLELRLSYPVRRRDAVLAKGMAVAAEILVVCVCGLAALVVLNEAVGLDLSFWRIAAALGGVAALGLFFGWLALAIGAAIPSRMLAVGVPAALAAAAYLVGGLHQLAGWLDPLRFLSPFWLVGSTPLQKGIDGWGTLAVVATAAGVLLLGSALVGRRDLETP
jgi:ABC-2 type transport system permease protein